MNRLESLGEVIDTDVLVIGGGMAGTFAAIKAKEEGADKVLLVDKAKTGKSGCAAFAAGVFFSFIPGEDDYQCVSEGRQGIDYYFNFYNHERPHQSLNYMTPAEVYFQRKAQREAEG